MRIKTQYQSQRMAIISSIEIWVNKALKIKGLADFYIGLIIFHSRHSKYKMINWDRV
jgi:hypothetical protein